MAAYRSIDLLSQSQLVLDGTYKVQFRTRERRPSVPGRTAGSAGTPTSIAAGTCDDG